MAQTYSAEGRARLVWATVLGGAAAGFLDLISAFASLVPHGATVTGILHYIASGAIGPSALTAGLPTALLGVAVHFSLTTAMAGAFVLAAWKVPVILRWPWLSGILWGAATFLLMNYVAVPLSGAPGWKPPTGWSWVQALMGGCFYVGVPIAFVARAFLTRPFALANVYIGK